ncbi:hypothetical protein [Geobacter argillaceus]|uniref:hypothetical protein n=1 Tax=Geobacter argillaceus TaxID=345631 RepID=UPI001FE482DD|nr:hypothetical protein [Geobacter argillaceus]
MGDGQECPRQIQGNDLVRRDTASEEPFEGADLAGFEAGKVAVELFYGFSPRS